MSTIIRTRSPFFIRTPEETSANLDYFEIVIAIVSGEVASSAPNDLTDQIQITKKPINTENSVSFDISEIVNSSFSQNIDTTGLSDSYRKFQSLWVTVTSQAKESDGTNIGSLTTNIYLAQEGYNTFLEGVNFTTNKRHVLITSTNIQYKSGESFKIPVNTETVSSVQFYSDIAQTNLLQTTSITDSATDADNKITYVIPSASTIASHIRSIKITAGSTIETITVEPIDECKYSFFKCSFLNRWGAYQDVFFFKKSIENLDTKKENFNRSIFSTVYEYNDGSSQTVFNTYSTNQHSKKTYNTSGIESLILNTGFVNESMNETFKELLVSEYVYLTDSSATTYPVNLKDSSLTYKTSLNDKMINYTMSFEKSFNYINNVR